jgi:hypothetical protein
MGSEINGMDLLNSSVDEKIQFELKKLYQSKRSKIISKIISAALGAVPWIGGFLSAAKEFKSDESVEKRNLLYEQWLEEHKKKMNILSETIFEVVARLNEFSDEIDERLESEEYLQIVKKSFRILEDSDTIEKRDLVRKLLTNAGAQKLVHDDLIRLFLSWINLYHEVHFSIIGAIYKETGLTRFDIWQELNGASVREDSSDADLYKLIFRDLSTGGIIRQHKQTDYYGNFVKQPSRKNSNPSRVLKSAFDDQETYELTELGKQFVHYTMTEVVPRIS